MDLKEKTFDLTDLDEMFWSRVLLIEIFPSSGYFGQGFVQMFTADAYYIARYNDLGIKAWWELEQLHTLFKRKETFEGTRNPYLVEGNGWTYIERERLLIRDDFYKAFMTVYVEEVTRPANRVRCVDISGMVGRALGLEYMECFRFQP